MAVTINAKILEEAIKSYSMCISFTNAAQ